MGKTILYILLPCYNAEKTIGRAIDSVINQLSDEIKLLIVNDGSSDKSEEIIKGYLKKNEYIGYITQKNGGLSNALYKGVEWIKKNINSGDVCYVARLDSDDEYTETGAVALLKTIKKHKGKYMCYLGGLLNSDGSNFSIILKPNQYFSYEEFKNQKVALSLDSVSSILNLKVFYDGKYCYDKVPAKGGDGIPAMRVQRDFGSYMTDVYFYIVHLEPYSLSRRLISVEYAKLALEINLILLNEFCIPDKNKNEICLKSLICARYSAVLWNYKESFCYLWQGIKNINKDVDIKTVILYMGLIFVCLIPGGYRIVNFFVKKIMFKNKY